MPVVVHVTTSKLFFRKTKGSYFLSNPVYLHFALSPVFIDPIKRTAGVPNFDPEVDPQTNANLVNVSS